MPPSCSPATTTGATAPPAGSTTSKAQSAGRVQPRGLELPPRHQLPLPVDVDLRRQQVAGYQSEGFEMSLHPNTGCTVPWTETSLHDDIAIQLAELKTDKPSIVGPGHEPHPLHRRGRTGPPSRRSSTSFGMRLDTNYYTFPAQWIGDRPGMFTGSGFPMRFADLDGSMIDTYQATTQMSDEAGQTYPATIDALLDRALGSRRLLRRLHGEHPHRQATPEAATADRRLAKAHGVPVISAAQLLGVGRRSQRLVVPEPHLRRDDDALHPGGGCRGRRPGGHGPHDGRVADRSPASPVTAARSPPPTGTSRA